MVIYSDGGDFLSMEDQLFLHLSDYHYEPDLYWVPECLTQKGIQRVLKCNVSHISRLLRKNERGGKIVRNKARTRNGRKSVYVFYLTDEGKRIAKSIYKMVKNINEI